MKGLYTPPRLTTQRLLLRPMRYSDLQGMHRLRSDPETAALMGISVPPNLETTANYLRSMLDGTASGNWLFWVLTLPGQDAFLGSIVLWNYHPDNNEAEVGYSLLPEHRGLGYMQEGLQAVINYVFTWMQIAAINAYTKVDNTPSLNLLERCSFTYLRQVFDESASGETMHLAHYAIKNRLTYSHPTH
ncbi:MAG: GNAT family N-acetyltransferase [Symbiobacteriaceae bacterium]|nr:GNAT family N-acetyltransferase [Symbiobacteriaceae bacterium]